MVDLNLGKASCLWSLRPCFVDDCGMGSAGRSFGLNDGGGAGLCPRQSIKFNVSHYVGRIYVLHKSKTACQVFFVYLQCLGGILCHQKQFHSVIPCWHKWNLWEKGRGHMAESTQITSCLCYVFG